MSSIKLIDISGEGMDPEHGKRFIDLSESAGCEIVVSIDAS